PADDVSEVADRHDMLVGRGPALCPLEPLNCEAGDGPNMPGCGRSGGARAGHVRIGEIGSLHAADADHEDRRLTTAALGPRRFEVVDAAPESPKDVAEQRRLF